MTQEEKDLLLKDLCARLPYHDLWVQYNNKDWLAIGYGHERIELLPNIFSSIAGPCPLIDEIKPYLRLMSSMTDKEKEELKQEHLKDERLFAECLTKAANGDDSMRGKVIPHFAADWCDENHFDYRGLIPMGLALEAPEDMY